MSTRAKNAIGRHGGEQPLFEVGELADFVVFGSAEVATRGRGGGGSLQEVVCDPPKERHDLSRASY